MTQSAFSETNAPRTHRLSTDEGSSMDALVATSAQLEPKLRRILADGKVRVNELRGDVQDGIRQKPIQTVLIAAALGAFLGLILRRRG